MCCVKCVKHHIHTNHSSISPLIRTMVVIQSDKMQGNSETYIDLYRRKMAPLCRTKNSSGYGRIPLWSTWIQWMALAFFRKTSYSSNDKWSIIRPPRLGNKMLRNSYISSSQNSPLLKFILNLHLLKAREFWKNERRITSPVCIQVSHLFILLFRISWSILLLQEKGCKDALDHDVPRGGQELINPLATGWRVSILSGSTRGWRLC